MTPGVLIENKTPRLPAPYKIFQHLDLLKIAFGPKRQTLFCVKIVLISPKLFRARTLEEIVHFEHRHREAQSDKPYFV